MKTNIRPVSQGQFDQFGVYMWQMPDGSYIADDHRNFLSIASQFGDLTRISKLRSYVKMLGIHEGKPVFFAGHRKVTDEEYAEQQSRLKEGFIPDEYDLPAHIEDHRDRR